MLEYPFLLFKSPLVWIIFMLFCLDHFRFESTIMKSKQPLQSAFLSTYLTYQPSIDGRIRVRSSSRRCTWLAISSTNRLSYNSTGTCPSAWLPVFRFLAVFVGGVSFSSTSGGWLLVCAARRVGFHGAVSAVG